MQGLRRLLWLLNFCIIAGISFLCVVLIFPQELKPIDLGEEVIGSPGVRRPPQTSREDLSSIDGLFWGEHKSQTPSPSQPRSTLHNHIKVEAIFPCYDRSGAIDRKHTFASIVWIQKNNARDKIVAGQELEAGGDKWRVVEITEHVVRFRSGEREEVLNPEHSSQGPSPTSGRSHKPGQDKAGYGIHHSERTDYRVQSHRPVSEPNIKIPSPGDFNTYQKSPNHWVVDHKERDFYLQYGEDILEQRAVEGQPYVLPDGNMDGIEITSINNPLLAERGLKAGDILKSVNGRKINSTEAALDLFHDPAIRNARRLTIEVERSGRIITILYDFQ